MLENLSIPLEKIVGISTDGARAMSSMNVGVTGLLFNEIKNLTGKEIFANINQLVEKKQSQFSH